MGLSRKWNGRLAKNKNGLAPCWTRPQLVGAGEPAKHPAHLSRKAGDSMTHHKDWRQIPHRLPAYAHNDNPRPPQPPPLDPIVSALVDHLLLIEAHLEALAERFSAVQSLVEELIA